MQGLDLQIEKLRQQFQMDYVDAVIEFAEQNNTDIEDVVKGLHSSTKDKIKYEFIKRNMVRGEKLETGLEAFFE